MEYTSATGAAPPSPQPLRPPAIELPRGGGAVRGLQETFSPTVTGGAGLVVPLGLPAGRDGFGPALALAYSSSGGAGPLGLGWDLGLAAVSLRTERGVPRYDGEDEVLLAGAPLVRARDEAGEVVTSERTVHGHDYTITRFRPRVESAHALIERWTGRDRGGEPGDVRWRVISADHVTSWFGRDGESRVSDPLDPRRIASWLPCLSYDDAGNVVIYHYRVEDSAGVAATPAEAGRNLVSRTAQRYLARVGWGNRTPYRPRLTPDGDPDPEPGPDDLMFHLVLDHGDHDLDQPRPEPDGQWPLRPDVFTSHRAGFTVSTYRRCRRLLVFHSFPGAPPFLVTSTTLEYAQENEQVASLLRSITRTGHDGATALSLPSLDLAYQPWALGAQVKTVEREQLTGDPAGLAGDGYEWVDLDGDGLPGILTRRDGAWFYKRNLSPLAGIQPGTPAVRFAAPVPVPLSPAGLPSPAATTAATGFTATGTRANWGPGAEPRPPGEFVDVTGDGTADLLLLDGPAPGAALREGRAWTAFRPFPSAPGPAGRRAPALNDGSALATVLAAAATSTLADLTGDGRADLLVGDGSSAWWHAGLGPDGFGPALPVVPVGSPPVLLHAGRERLVALADLDGDGLVDLVEVTRTAISYRPSLGHGRFGPVVMMDDAPALDDVDSFEAGRVLLVDVDGTGPADLVYLGARGAVLHRNESGQAWSQAIALPGVPAPDRMSSVAALDLFGRGTAALVWSTTAPLPGGLNMRYLDLAAAGKPHLLSGYDNGLGLVVDLEYTPSTAFRLADDLAGRPWPTRLPFPVHCLSQVVTRDLLRGTTFIGRRTYHLGHYDGAEREFAGFGRIDSLDAEELPGSPGDLPPVLTRRWFHVGASGRLAQEVLAAQRAEYAAVDGVDLPPPAVEAGPTAPAGLSSEDLRHATRALAGLQLRSEVFAGTPADPAPTTLYRVSERTATVVVLQPHAPASASGNDDSGGGAGSSESSSRARPGEAPVVQVLPLADLACAGDGDGDPADARITENVVLSTDDLGLVTLSASIVRPRRVPDPAAPADVQAAQARLSVTAAEHEFTTDVIGDDIRRLRSRHRSADHELARCGLDLAAGALAQRDRLREIASSATELDPDTDPDTTPGTDPVRRLLGRSQTLFLDEALSGPLPPGLQAGHGLAHSSHVLAMTAPMAALRLGADADDADLTAAGYVHQSDDAWWVPGARAEYGPDARAHFLQPVAVTDPFGTRTSVERVHDLLVTAVVDARGHRTEAEFDLRVLAPRLVTDPDGNRRAAAFDALGSPVAAAVMGRDGDGFGDTLADPTVRTEYDLGRWRASGEPAVVRSFARERHGVTNPRWQESRTYLDGSGGALMVKSQAAPGLANHWDEATGTLSSTDTSPLPRWIGTGRTVLNNKGLPVQAYEPYFSDTPEFESAAALVEAGVSDVVDYDPLGRARRVDHPDGTFARVEFTPWTVISHDAVDTVLDSTWYVERGSPDPTGPEPVAGPQRAAWIAAGNAGTPTVQHLDVLGRPVHGEADNGGGDVRHTRIETDLSGLRVTVRDALDRVVSTTWSDLTGASVRSDEAERGHSLALVDVLGALSLSVDHLGRRFSVGSDDLRRPVTLSCLEAGAAAPAVLTRVRYGDDPSPGQSPAEATERARTRNAVGRPVEILDQAGALFVSGYAFDGAGLGAERRYSRRRSGTLDWTPVLAAADPDAARDALLEAESWPGTAEHDALGRPVRLTLADTSVLTPRYDEANRITGLDVQIAGTGPAVPMLTGQEHDALGRVTSRTLGNGVTTTFAYDRLSRRLDQLRTTGSAGGGQVLQDLTYTYDPAGNVTGIEDGAQQSVFFANAVVPPSRTFTHDALNQLVAATGRELAGLAMPAGADVPGRSLPDVNDLTAVQAYTQRFSYDRVGNLETVQHLAATGSWTRQYRYGYQANPLDPSNRVLATSGPGDPAGTFSHTYDYDDLGNLTGMPQVNSLSWDLLGRLAVADLGGGGSAGYAYDVGGARVRKVLDRGGTLVETLYLGACEISREWHGPTLHRERRTLHVPGDSGRIAQIDRVFAAEGGPVPAEPVTRFVHGDHLGSASLLSDGQGRVVSYEEYHPFGTTAYRSAAPGADLSLHRYRLLDRERDDETGLYHLGARQYAPWLGRFVSPDPAGPVDGLNLYRYARNNPVTLRDPSGTQSATVDVVKKQEFTGKETFEELQRQSSSIPGYEWDPAVTPENYKSFYHPGPGKGGAGGIWEVVHPATTTTDDDDPAAPDSQGGTGDEASEHPSPDGTTSDSTRDAKPDAKAGEGAKPSDTRSTTPSAKPAEGTASADKAADRPTSPGNSSGGQGAVGTYDSSKRMSYIDEAQGLSKEGLDKLKTTAPGEELALAEKVSTARSGLRTATQGELSPGGRAMSKAIDTGQSFEESVTKYSERLPNVEGGARTAAESDAELARRIIKGAGETRGSMKTLAKVGRVAGPVALAVGAVLSIWAIADAPEGQRGRVASREAGSWIGGAIGASVGMSAGVAVAGFLSGLLIGLGIISGPLGWLAIGLGIGLGVLVGGAVGYWWSKRGGQIGEGIYDAVAD